MIYRCTRCGLAYRDWFTHLRRFFGLHFYRRRR